MNYKWGVFSADLNPVIGSEKRGTRPVIVVSDEDFNVVMLV
jgi:mRNA interferase MazF